MDKIMIRTSPAAGVESFRPQYTTPEKTFQTLLYAAKTQNLQMFTNCYSKKFHLGPEAEGITKDTPEFQTWADTAMSRLKRWDIDRGHKLEIRDKLVFNRNSVGYTEYINGEAGNSAYHFHRDGKHWLISDLLNY